MAKKGRVESSREMKRPVGTVNIEQADDNDLHPKPGPSRKKDRTEKGEDDDDDDIIPLHDTLKHPRKLITKDGLIDISSSSEDDDVTPSSDVKFIRRRKGHPDQRNEPPNPVVNSEPLRKRVKLKVVPEGNTSNGNNGDENVWKESHGAKAGPIPPEAADESPKPCSLPRAEYLVTVVLDILPDLCPKWASESLKVILPELAKLSNVPGQDAVDRVINAALEMGHYPKVKNEEEAAPVATVEKTYDDPTYRKKHRLGEGYLMRAQTILQDTFLNIPVTHIRFVFNGEGQRLLMLSYSILNRDSMAEPKPYDELKKYRSAKGKMRANVYEEIDILRTSDGEQDRSGFIEIALEKRYMETAIEKRQSEQDAEKSEAAAKALEKAEKDIAREKAIALGGGLECGCCFGEDTWEEMSQCPEGHLFCRSCLVMHAETKLGNQQVIISCMDTSGCGAVFGETELSRILSDASLSLYHRIKQLKDLEMADIPGLESCPYCPFALVIDNDHEKLFRCLNDNCLKISCRKCKRPDHIPKSCEEMEADRKLDKRHIIEEAMSEALVRKCPKCGKPYIKESGCNKITCNYCQTISCYICQKAIPEGYAHFAPNPPNAQPQTAPPQAKKCRLWHENEAVIETERVRKARKKAEKLVRAAAEEEGVVLNDEDLTFDAPVGMVAAPTQLPERRLIAGRVPLPFAGVGNAHHRPMAGQMEHFAFGNQLHGGLPPRLLPDLQLNIVHLANMRQLAAGVWQQREHRMLPFGYGRWVPLPEIRWLIPLVPVPDAFPAARAAPHR